MLRCNIQEPLDNIHITEETVLNKVEQLKVDKSPGPDNINARILKELKDNLCEVLADLFKMSLIKGKLPDDCKSASISAIYKKGDKEM